MEIVLTYFTIFFTLLHLDYYWKLKEGENKEKKSENKIVSISRN